MKPYYEDGQATIYNADCRDVLSSLPPSDAMVTDPPYGIGYASLRPNDPIAGDASPEDARGLLRAALRLTRAGVYFVCCDWRSLGWVTEEMTWAKLPPKSCIVWDKGHGVQNLDRFAKAHEFVVYAGPFGGEKTLATDVWRVPRDFQPDHPTPKPVGLMARCIQFATPPRCARSGPVHG